MELWQLKFSLVEYSGATLVRATHIRGDKWWKDKPYRDFDPKSFLQSPVATASVLSFTESFGFTFPLPVGPKTWGKIMALSQFPEFEEWEKAYGSYSREDYQADLKRFWGHRSLATRRTHEKLHISIRKTATRLAAGFGPLGNAIIPQDQAAYARMALLTFYEAEERLNDFWGEQTVPEEVTKALRVLNNLVSVYLPEVKQNKKKELAATREMAPAKKKGRKAKQPVEGQETLW